MTSIRTRCVRLAIGLLAVPILVISVPSGAQVTPPQFVQAPEDAGGALSRHLVTIAENPRDIAALKGAGQAALTLGDAQAALGFFARAEEVSPRDGSVKAGIGSALVMLEQGRPALRYFDDAMRLGVTEPQIAGYRGLAFDLTGNPRLAQKDYQTALRRGEDPEVRRRLALSLAISGDRAEALRTIDDQVRRQDRAGWRTRAFVLALTGDTAGAMSVVRSMMPAQAAAMAPFLARLPTLGPADRALAVNFGHFPGTGANVVPADDSAAFQDTPRTPLDSVVDAGRPDPAQQRLGTVRPALGAAGTGAPAAAAPSATAGITASDPPAAAASLASGPPSEATASIGQSPPSSQSLTALSPPAEEPQSSILTPIQDIGIETASAAPASARQALIVPIPLPASSTPDTGASVLVEPVAAPPARLADIAALVEALPAVDPSGGEPSGRKASEDEAAVKPSAAPPTVVKVDPSKPRSPKPQAAKPQVAKAKPAPPRETSRIWVQVAGGADKTGLPREYARLKGLAPNLFKGMTAWTTPLRATNRLLVGPFKTEREAQAFINQLNKAKLAGFSWTSSAGQVIEKLPAR